MFDGGGLLAGVLAALFIGVSKTGLPGVGIVSIPLLAVAVDGRMIPGTALPLLIAADFFALAWYRSHARWDVLRPLVMWLSVGFVGGIAFFVIIGSATEALEMSIGLVVLVIVSLQLWRMFREPEPRPLSPAETAGYGSMGGFTTFVANAAGPVINTYLAGLRLPKAEVLGTASWLYFILNVAKIPFYLALGVFSDGGAFFTGESLLFDLLLVPGVVAGVFVGRAIYRRISQKAFIVVILILSAVGAANLIF